MSNRGRKDDFKDRRQRLDAAMLQRFDQELQEVRSLYDKLTHGERKQFRLWLQRLSEADAEKVPWLPMSLMVHTTEVVHDDNNRVVYEGHAEIAPHVLLKAVDAWSRGEDFLPGSWIDTA